MAKPENGMRPEEIMAVKKKTLTPVLFFGMIAQVIDVNKILEQALLFDFYGELLTEHQKEIYGQFIQEDLSLGEIAKEAGISRQGVHDLVRRCSQTLAGYEEKLHLVEKFVNIRGQVQKIHELASGYHADDIVAISNVILEEL